MKKHFVTFFSPGTFVAEGTTRPIANWDVPTAVKMSKGLKERCGATPYAFRFTTRERKADELDSTVVKTSGLHYLGGKVETLAQIKKRADPSESVLVSNMEMNGWNRVVTTTIGYKWTQPLRKGDVVLTAKGA